VGRRAASATASEPTSYIALSRPFHPLAPLRGVRLLLLILQPASLLLLPDLCNSILLVADNSRRQSASDRIVRL
jgi:hypothetical protein